jgi:glucose-6-phosphate dehydrogenase assembly protein OpcA
LSLILAKEPSLPMYVWWPAVANCHSATATLQRLPTVSKNWGLNKN